MSTVSRAKIPQNFDIQEDSTFLKVITAVPILGIFSRIIINPSLREQVDQALRGPPSGQHLLLKLIEIRNEYLVADIVRSVATIALLIAGLVLGIFGTIGLIGKFLIGGFIGFSTLFAAMYLGHLLHNRKVIGVIEENGYYQRAIVK